MEFLEVLTEGLEKVLMVRGGGREVITIYSWTRPALSRTARFSLELLVEATLMKCLCDSIITISALFWIEHSTIRVCVSFIN